MHGDKVTVLVNFLNHFLTIESVSVIFHVKGESKSLREFVRYYESWQTLAALVFCVLFNNMALSLISLFINFSNGLHVLP